jgi:hypothetical protein
MRLTPAMRLFSSVATISDAADFNDNVSGNPTRQASRDGFDLGQFRHEFSLQADYRLQTRPWRCHKVEISGAHSYMSRP